MCKPVARMDVYNNVSADGGLDRPPVAIPGLLSPWYPGQLVEATSI